MSTADDIRKVIFNTELIGEERYRYLWVATVGWIRYDKDITEVLQGDGVTYGPLTKEQRTALADVLLPILYP